MNLECCIIDSMTDFQPQGQNWSEKNPVIGTGEGEVPLANAPMADVTMRTMSSDIASIKETGGGEPKSYNPQGMGMNVPPAQSAVVPPQADFGAMAPSPMPSGQPIQPPKKKVNWFAIIASLIGIVGILALLYFFIYPRFFSPAVVPPPATPATTTQEQSALPPATSTLPATPDAGLATGTQAAVDSQFQTVILHSSLFKTSADTSSEMTLPAVTLDAVKAAIQANTVAVPLLKEVVFKNSVGKVYALSAIAPLFAPNVFNATTTAYFEPDASFFTYIDKTGVWPGVVMKLATGADITKAKAAVAQLESNNDFLSFFLTNPGTMGRWRDGKVGTFIARYVSFSPSNIAFSYTWVNNTLVISTSYAGAQSSTAKLGL